MAAYPSEDFVSMLGLISKFVPDLKKGFNFNRLLHDINTEAHRRGVINTFSSDIRLSEQQEALLQSVTVNDLRLLTGGENWADYITDEQARSHFQKGMEAVELQTQGFKAIQRAIDELSPKKETTENTGNNTS